MKEELKIEKQKEIIEKLVNYLSTQSESYYYDSTINICREIHHIIQSKEYLNNQQSELVETLSTQDIQTLLSYNSSCC